MPVTTAKDVALDVFVKMNTTAVKLTPFDIVVAQVEATAGESLHDLVNKLRGEVGAIEHYIAPEDLILSVAAMRQDRSPNQSSYQNIDLRQLVDSGTSWLLASNGPSACLKMSMYSTRADYRRLPSYTC